MVVPWICVSISKSQVIWRKPKKSRFLHFSVSLSKKNSSGRQSDTIEDWRLAHSSFRRLCSNFFKTHVEVSDTFKNMGVRPPQSQLIRICVPQKSCFLATFFGKILVLTHFDTTYPPPMIYIVGKLWISRFMSSRPHTPEFNLYAVRFFVTLRESSHHRTSHSVISSTTICINHIAPAKVPDALDDASYGPLLGLLLLKPHSLSQL